MLAWLILFAGLFASGGPSGAHVLDVPYRDQLDGSAYALANCGPTALSMVLAYYGVEASPWDLRVRSMRAQHSWVTDEGGYHDYYGVFVYNLATVAEGIGLHVSGLWDREGARVDRLHQWQPADIRRELAAAHPVIVQVRYSALPSHGGAITLADHYVVMTGTDDDGFVYNDPLGSNGGPDQTISERDLLAAMSAASTPRVAFAVVKPRI